MCTEDSPSGLWRTLGKRVGCKPSGVRIPHPPPLAPEPIEVPGFLLLVAPPDLRPPRVLPAREPSAPRASLGASSRSPARPRRPRGGLQSGGACCSDLGSGLRPPAGAVVWPCVPKPALALRTLRHPSHRWRLSCCVHWPGPAGLAAASNRAALIAVSGLALPTPAGTAARPWGFPGGYQSCGYCLAAPRPRPP